MADSQGVHDIIVFVTAYLVLSLVPFVILNHGILGDVQVFVAQDIVTVALAGVLLFVAISGLFLAREGVDRYNQFLFAPTDALSVLMVLFFVLASFSWWLVPELTFYYELGFGLAELLALIIACQLPMVMFLSLMTAIGKV